MVTKVKVFVAGHCEPCQEVKDLIAKGQFIIDGEEGEIDLIDIESEEGFPQIKENNITGVPQAFREGKQCRIHIDEEDGTLLIDCNDEETEAVEENDTGKNEKS